MFEKKILMSLLCLVVMLSLLAPATRGANILFVSSMTTEADDALKAFMEGLGHTVTYIDDDEDEAATEAAAAAADLVYISESVGSGGIKNEITEVEVPMIIGEPWAWDEMGLTEGDGGDDPAVTTDVDIVGAGHYLAGGLSGSVGVLTEVLEGCNLGKGVTGPEATVIATATLSDGVTYDVIFVYEKGAALPVAPADGSAQVAADMRIGFGFHENCYPVLNENAYALLGAAVEYALGMTGPSEPVNPGTNGLVASYALDGDATDSSGNGLDGTLVGDATFGEGPTSYGMALELDGVDDYVDCGSPPELVLTEAISIACWVNPTAFEGRQGFAGLDTGFVFKVHEQGRLCFTTPGIADHESANSILKAGVWQHVAATFLPGQDEGLVFYINGVETERMSSSAINAGSGPFRIGNNQWSELLTGLIDEVAIYSRILSEAELRYLAGERAVPVDPGTDGLVAYYPLDIDALDASGNGNDGILNGDPQWVDGKVGGALEMDGGDYVEVPSAADINPESITLMTWVNFSTVDGADMERQDYLSRGDDYAFSLHEWGYRDGTEAEGKISAIVTSAGGWTVLTGTTLVEPETWYHTTLTYDSDTQMLKLYLDGEVEGEMDLPTGLEHRLGGSLTIGTYNGRDLLGKIDDIKIYNRALSTGEIRYLAGFRAMENPDIAAINELFNQATLAGSTGDVELYLSLFTEDAVVMAPGYTAFVGKEVLRPTFEGLFGLFDLELPYTVDEIVIPGDWAFVRSRFQYSMTPKEGGETTTNPGEELDILKRQADGSWKIYLECWNYDVPLPVPEVAATSEELGVVKLAQVDDADAMYREMCDLYALAAETGDVDLYVANYTADGVQMPPEAPNRIGSDEIRAAIEPALTLFDIECPIYPKEAVITGDWAFGWCEWSLSLTPKEGGQTTTFDGKGLDVIKRQADGSWKYYIECWNYNGPPTVE